MDLPPARRITVRDAQLAHDLSVGLLELSDGHEFRIWTVTGSCLLGAAQVELGPIDPK